MAKTDFKTVDEYINTFPENEREVLEKIRKTIKNAVPEAEEVISYQLPAYKYHGFVMYFSGNAKNHYSIAVPPSKTFEHFSEELTPFNVSVSTVQFPKDQPIPFDLIARMAQFKSGENLNKVNKK